MRDYGSLHFRIEEILRERKISKTKICRELEIARPNFNRYCRDEFQRIDAQLLCKLCYYLECEITDVLVYERPDLKKPIE